MSILDALGCKDKAAGRIYGVAAATVTNNEGKLGTLKLKFHWLSDDNETDWVRMTTFMAGGGRGGFFLPEVGDEVLVAFEHGDINRPYVIGVLWNDVAPPPETNSDKQNNIRKIKSRSGHEIIFNDDRTAKQEKIEIHTNAGHKIVLDDTDKQEKIEIIDKSGNNKITINSNQNSITIIAENVKIEGTRSLTLSSKGNLKIKGSKVYIN